jgi:hypothetical protein
MTHSTSFVSKLFFEISRTHQSCTSHLDAIHARESTLRGVQMDESPINQRKRRGIMKIRKLLIVAISFVGLHISSATEAEQRSPLDRCIDSFNSCVANAAKCVHNSPQQCEARCSQKYTQCTASAAGKGGKRTTSGGGAAGAGNTTNIPGTKTGVNTNAGAASGTTINASGAKSAPTQQMPTSTNPVAGGGGGAGQPPRSRRM